MYVVAVIVLALGLLGWGDRSVGQEVSAPRGEIHVVDTSEVEWAYITFNVFEHLIELDKDGNQIPGLATSWQWLDDRTLEVRLRQGVRFHNGEVFDAEVVKLNVEETGNLKHPFHLGNFLSFDPGARVEIVDRYTVRFLLPRPDGAALARLSYIHMGSREFYRAGGWGGKHW